MDAAELAGMRAEAEQLLTDSLDILRAALTADGELGYTETWATVATNVPCSVSELGAGRGDRELANTGAMRSDGEFMVRVAFGTDITAKDRVTWEGKTLDISRVTQRTRGVLLGALATELEG